MNGRMLFQKRLLKHWKYQYNIVKAVADWIVMLYIGIPAVVFLLLLYRSWWVEIPSWIEPIPLALILLLVYLFTWSGRIRTFVEEADKVFLVRNPVMLEAMKKWGYVYSLLIRAVSILFLFLFLLPILLNHYHSSIKEMIVFGCYFISLNSFLMLVNYHVKRIQRKWISSGITIIIFVILGALSQVIFSLVEKNILMPVIAFSLILLCFSIFYSIKTLKRRDLVNHDISVEQEEKTKLIQGIFMMSMEVETPVSSNRTKSFLFRKSQRIFRKRTAVNGFIEVFIKRLLRNSSYLIAYGQLLSVGSAVSILIPALWLKLVILSVLVILMYIWPSLAWDKLVKGNPLVRKYLDTSAYFIAKRKAVGILFFIMLVMLSGIIFLIQYLTASISLLG